MVNYLRLRAWAGSDQNSRLSVPAPIAAEECVRRDSGSIDALISEP